tara:strand:+ start:87 stop:413 length:327 start_codon:yes stop_codon:yes gene_type:complete
MIYQASKGSICFYYKGTLISGFGLTTKKSVDAYLYMGDHLIKQSGHVDIKQQIKTYLTFCNLIHRRKNNKLKINHLEHQLFVSSLCALLRLKIIDNDDNNGYLVCPRK